MGLRCKDPSVATIAHRGTVGVDSKPVVPENLAALMHCVPRRHPHAAALLDVQGVLVRAGALVVDDEDGIAYITPLGVSMYRAMGWL